MNNLVHEALCISLRTINRFTTHPRRRNLATLLLTWHIGISRDQIWKKCVRYRDHDDEASAIGGGEINAEQRDCSVLDDELLEDDLLLLLEDDLLLLLEDDLLLLVLLLLQEWLDDR